MSDTIYNIEHHDKINASFAESVYQQMVSKRYGMQFCCERDLKRDAIRKEQLDLSSKLDVDLVATFSQNP